jgi:hypothetical protein
MNNPPESIFVDTGIHSKDFPKNLEFESEMAKKQISLGDLVGNNMTILICCISGPIKKILSSCRRPYTVRSD